ncbi:TPA: hypothetical protein DCX16_04140 [bacterium]|nr:hypothetical protein [bacterium]
MARVFPFKGLLYNKEKVDISSVVAPPYDVISKKEQDEYYKKNPYNIIRLILGKEYPDDTDENNKYTRAGKYLSLWKEQGILEEDKSECFYLYEQEWEVGRKRGLFRGLICSLKIEDYGKNIFPHERTLEKPKEDRLKLLYATDTCFCYIFLVYSDKTNFISRLNKKNLFFECKYEKGSIKLFRIEEGMEEIKRFFLRKKFIIADGHHRYETALKYKREQGKTKTLAIVSSIENGEFVILPAHRLLKKTPDTESINRYFKIKEGIYKEKKGMFGMVNKNGSFILTPRIKENNNLDVEILHNALFDGKVIEEDIDYTMDKEIAISSVSNGNYACCFLLNPTKISDVIKRAKKQEFMPGKATYFYPKPFCGFVLHSLRNEE